MEDLLYDGGAGLILSRFRDEEVIIYDRDTFEVLAVVIMVEPRGDKARLGFKALKHVGVDRRELFLKKLEERKAKQRPTDGSQPPVGDKRP